MDVGGTGQCRKGLSIVNAILCFDKRTVDGCLSMPVPLYKVQVAKSISSDVVNKSIRLKQVVVVGGSSDRKRSGGGGSCSSRVR